MASSLLVVTMISSSQKLACFTLRPPGARALDFIIIILMANLYSTIGLKRTLTLTFHGGLHFFQNATAFVQRAHLASVDHTCEMNV
jgi:hypothetical protein